ncbi:neurotrypsin-like [Ylistrum balloti]|uniref:neurotrypsin-like n=1 Tax=Ylistrum balloti TaxID=509963 RepID=UPI0029059553|nr:neurotrypsin-like [Ylistrum balloti]
MASYAQIIFTIFLTQCCDTGETTIPTTTDSSFAIRLENGLYNNSGRVGVYHDGQWGGICDGSWSYNDANVACRMLGYTNGSITSNLYTVDSVWYQWFGNETDPDLVWMDRVRCTGTETSLADCPFDGWGIGNCGDGSWSRFAYVFCYNEDNSSMEVRLVNGRSDGYGLVEVHYSSYWGGIHYDGFFSNEAKVVCRTLGYSHGIHYGGSLISFNTVPRWMTRQCTGEEKSYFDCPFASDQNVIVGLGIASAVCYNQPEVGLGEDHPVYLVEKESFNMGAVEVVYGGQNATVCSKNWDNTEATIVCRMLGFRNGTAKEYPRYQWESTEDIGLKAQINCSGAESSIYECSFQADLFGCPFPFVRGGVSCSDYLANVLIC